jgi:hypothetical protein
VESALRAGATGTAWRASALWLGLAAALSPVLADLAQHWAAEPWARYSAVFVPLALSLAWSDAPSRRPRADGWLWIALALALALVSAGGGMARLGRPAIPIAVLGLARVLGRPAPVRAALAVWVVPLPNALLQATSPGLEWLVGAGLARAAAGLGIPLQWVQTRDFVGLTAPGGSLALGGVQGGLPLVALLAGLGWYAAARHDAPLRAAARRALRWAPWGLVVQAAAIALAAVLLAAGSPGAARGLLVHATWIAVAACGLVLAGAVGLRRGAVREHVAASGS